MTLVEKKANARLDELFEQKLAELEILLADKGADPDEIAAGIEYQRQEFERARADMIDWVRRVEAAGDTPASTELH